MKTKRTQDETTAATEKPKKSRGPRGGGGKYQRHRNGCERPVDKSGKSTCGCTWWISYQHPDGRRIAESSNSSRKGDADRLLQRRIGARANNLPVIPNVERLTFYEATQAVLNDFRASGKRSLDDADRKIRLHLIPYFGAGRKMVSLTSSDVTAYIAHRQRQGIERERLIVVEGGRPERKIVRVSDVSNAQINRELAILKRAFSLAVKAGRVASRPHIQMLDENNVRSGFFEPDRLASVVKHLPDAIQPVIEFASVTGWRITSEVLPLEWRQVDLKAGEVRLDAGTTKNKAGRVFPFTRDLRALLEARDTERKALVKAGHIVRWVFWRLAPDGKPKRIGNFRGAWLTACKAAGCPGRIPHDLRRTAVRNLTRAGIPQAIAMKLTGHKTDSVFRRYDIVSPNDLRVAVERLDAITPAASAR